MREYPSNAEPIVKRLAERLLANPPARQAFIDYVTEIRLAAMAPEEVKEERGFVLKVRFETELLVDESLKNLVAGRVMNERDALIHDLIKSFYGIMPRF